MMFLNQIYYNCGRMPEPDHGLGKSWNEICKLKPFLQLYNFLRQYGF